jgi:hypothetical protein
MPFSEISERAGAVKRVLQIAAKLLRLDGLGELAHALPLVDIPLGGKS